MKDNAKRIKTRHRLGKKYLYVTKLIKDLYPKIYKLLKFNNKKRNHQIHIWIKDLNRHVIKEDTKWEISIGKIFNIICL